MAKKLCEEECSRCGADRASMVFYDEGHELEPTSFEPYKKFNIEVYTGYPFDKYEPWYISKYNQVLFTCVCCKHKWSKRL